MGVLANFKIRTKVLIALLPLTIMVIVAALYASVEIKSIDTAYSDLIENQVKAYQRITVARALNNRFDQYLYREIAEADPEQKRIIDADLNQTEADFRSAAAEAKRRSPELTATIDSLAALFEQLISDSRPVRAATQAQDNNKAMRLMHETVEPEWQKIRQALADRVDVMQMGVDQRSAELSVHTHRVVFITWIALGMGLLVSLGSQSSSPRWKSSRLSLRFATGFLRWHRVSWTGPSTTLHAPMRSER